MTKAHASPVDFGNRLLDALPAQEKRRIAPFVRRIPLGLKVNIHHVRQAIDHVYFPLSGVLSAMTLMDDGRAIEVATIGREGLAGLTVLVGNNTSPYQVMVQVAGEAWRMSVDDFARETRREGALREVISRYHTAFFHQLSYAIACNGLHTVEKRCCRWLLMTHDRIGAATLPLTHELLAIMLGVRRASVTEVLHPLQLKGLIRCGRGEIEVLNRRRLEKAACECYRAVVEEFERQFGE